MRRIALVALVATGGALVTAGTAGAKVGDIDDLTIKNELTGVRNTVLIEGRINCSTTMDFGLVVKATQDPEDTSVTNPGADSRVETVGAWGPDFQGSESPCGSGYKDYDVVATRNNRSDDFHNGRMGVIVLAGTSANDGRRAPGPIVGDMEALGEVVAFRRNR